MQVFRSLPEYSHSKNEAVVTDGFFDGVHLGHQVILKHLANFSKLESVVITYWPHPRHVINDTSDEPKLLNTLEEKVEQLKKIGINKLLIIPFNKEFSGKSHHEFVRKILIDTVNTKKLIIGYNHKFGKDRKGDFSYLKSIEAKGHFTIEEIPKHIVEKNAVSSTKIREALVAGKIQDANTYLGYQYCIEGKVVHGKQIGRKIGFPTANLKILSTYKLIPKNGVYAVKVFIENQYFDGMLNIGYRPTVPDQKKHIEVNIFNFNEDIYGKSIRIVLANYLREEKKMNNLEELKSQLTLDKKHIIKALQNIENP